MAATINIEAGEMNRVFFDTLQHLGFTQAKADSLAEVFTSNSVDGVYTHGVNRFPVFVQYVKDGLVQKNAEPSLQSAFNGMEQWHGNLGPGPLNAIRATARAAELAEQFGIGCVALAHTNHWMRGGYYGWQAAKRGCVFIGWSNTIANMPAWRAVDARLGNNPLVLALPFGNDAIVLDMAMSQYSFGAMELAAASGKQLPVNGGYDLNGKLTTDPSAILQTRRSLPIGYWKGAGLSLLLDVLAAVLSGGLAVSDISAKGNEQSLSQVFFCIDLSKLGNANSLAKMVENIINDYHLSQGDGTGTPIAYPGERVLQTRKRNLVEGIPVLRSVWDTILKLQA